MSDENPYSVMEYLRLGPAADRADADEAEQLLLTASGLRRGMLLTAWHLGGSVAGLGIPFGCGFGGRSDDVNFCLAMLFIIVLLWFASRVWCLVYVTRGYVSTLNLPLALCGFIPVFGLLPYLLVWFNATRKLEKHGIRVGFFGASREHVLEALRK